jgi:hypothetical protein
MSFTKSFGIVFMRLLSENAGYELQTEDKR